MSAKMQECLNRAAELRGYSSSCSECGADNPPWGSDLYYDPDKEYHVMLAGFLCDECDTFAFTELRPIEIDEERFQPVKGGGYHE